MVCVNQSEISIYLKCLLRGEETIPSSLDVSDELALGGEVGGSVGQPQLGLEGVEVSLQLGLLLHPWGLVLPPVTNQR